MNMTRQEKYLLLIIATYVACYVVKEPPIKELIKKIIDSAIRRGAKISVYGPDNNNTINSIKDILAIIDKVIKDGI